MFRIKERASSRRRSVRSVVLLCWLAGISPAAIAQTPAQPAENGPLPAPSFAVPAPDLSSLEKLRATPRPVSPELREVDAVVVKEAVGTVNADTAGRMTRFAAQTGVDASVLTTTLGVQPAPSPSSTPSGQPQSN